jgi:hypothetical protein
MTETKIRRSWTSFDDAQALVLFYREHLLSIDTHDHLKGKLRKFSCFRYLEHNYQNIEIRIHPNIISYVSSIPELDYHQTLSNILLSYHARLNMVHA